MLRVAAYCRVSTSQEDQRNSLENQRRYFSEYISRQPDWELVEVYADEGLSGTSSDRPAFRRMLAAAAEEKIDLILTKEVSRFARNTVDTLAYTRLLRRQGVGIVFIGDHIDTRQNDGEFRLTIMASVAQEESRKISERVKWGQQRSMERGVVFGCDNIYGFSLQGGELTVKPEQAAVVREVYRRFLMDGKGTYIIARELTAEGIPPPSGKGKSWSSTMVLRLLRGEKYCGDLLQCKSCTPDFLDHRKVRGSHRRSICGIITRRLCRARCSRLSGGNSTAGRRTAKPAADPPRGTGAPEKWSVDGAAVGLCRAGAHRRTAVYDGCAGNGCSTAWQRVRLRQLGIGFCWTA